MAQSTVRRVKSLKPRLRVQVGEDIALGPGKVELLEHIAATGSIQEAAKRTGLSYMRAWLLIRTMNRCFREPVVLSLRGGSRGGGAQLTETGRQALAIYQAMLLASTAAVQKEWKKLQRLLG